MRRRGIIRQLTEAFMNKPSPNPEKQGPAKVELVDGCECPTCGKIYRKMGRKPIK